ncbi:MAG: signal peptide peptidase SppA [Acidobacteriota bacterium]|nr:signal peptide peptidase SppA [Acidobacteriota bacterium]
MTTRGKVLLFVFLLLIVVGIGLVILGFSLGGMGGGKVPTKTILEADFEQGVAEFIPADPLAQLLHENEPVVLDLVQALQRGAEDDRVVGLVAHIGASGMGMARVQELRSAVRAFGDAGKPTIAWSETFGEFSAANNAYYLATGFDQIYLQPSGDIGLTGLIAESPFLRGTLDKLGVQPRMDHRYEYKNAMNTFTEEQLTEPHREAMQALLDSWFDQMVEGIAEAREMSPEEVRQLVDRGPFLGQEAMTAGLVDGLAYRDEVYANMRQQLGDDAELLYLTAYLKRAGRPNDDGEVVALIYGVGAVARGESQLDPITGGMTMGSDAVSRAFRQAIDDEDVKAILFRVDSPGGSYVASDTIWRETVRAKQAGKPVIVSMGDLAGSGGYFVAMHADKIVAQPGTITGSIGVLGGKLITRDMWNKIGMTFDSVQTSTNASMFSSQQDYSESEYARFQAWLDRVYEDFTGKVADGRGMPLESVQEVAKGRIWTGEDALQRGLVDDLGGFPEALALAREAAGLTADQAVHLKRYPQPGSPFEQLFADPPSSSEEKAAVTTAVRALETLQPLARAAQQVGLLESPRSELAMPLTPAFR